MFPINATNCFDGWQKACREILQHGQIDNLLIKFSTPCDYANLRDWLDNRNPNKISQNADNIRHVINTIFPYNLYQLVESRASLYQRYKNIYINGSNRSWGTYFQRLISFDKHFQNSGVNQLENAINALLGNIRSKHYIVFHLSAINLDSNIRPIGSPCWHFGEVTINQDDSINLIAVYRNHDYFNKALGNFIGLSKLLQFIAIESNRVVGNLIIHSIHAFNNSSNSNLATLSS